MALAHAHGPGHDQPFSRKEASTLGLPSRFWRPPPPYCCPYRLPYCSFTSFWLARRRARGGRLDLS